MKLDEIVTRDPEILGGIPVFKGTRVPVDTLINYLKTGASLDAFLQDFSSVKREQAEVFLRLSQENRRQD